jgi:hypothetical protein
MSLLGKAFDEIRNPVLDAPVKDDVVRKAGDFVRRRQTIEEKEK